MVSFFFFHNPFFDCGAIFRGDTQPLEKKPIRFPDAKCYAESFEQKKYLKTIIIPEACKVPENWWYVLVPFEIFVQILGTVKDSSIKRFVNSIRFKFHLSTYCYMYQKKMLAWKAAAGGPLLEISYIPLLSVMTIHYDGVYQISSLSANLSLEDLKQFLRQTQPKTNNEAWFIQTMIKKNSKHTHNFIFPETPETLCLMLQRLNQFTLLVHT